MLSVVLALSFVAGGLAQYLRLKSKNNQLISNNSTEGNPTAVSSVFAIRIEPSQPIDLVKPIDKVRQEEADKIRKWWVYAQEETVRRAYLDAKICRSPHVKANLEMAECFIYLEMPLEYRMGNYARHCFCAFFATSHDSSVLTDDQKTMLDYTGYRVDLLKEYYKNAHVVSWQEELETYSIRPIEITMARKRN